MDKFCSPLKEGTNLEVLNKGKRWFGNKNIKVVKYLYCSENVSRNKDLLSNRDLKSCCICGTRLYKIDEESRYATGDDKNIKIAQKRHLVFVDNTGKKHYTCYGLNRCFKRIDYDIDKDIQEVTFEPPIFENFCGDKTTNNEYANYSAKEKYGQLVIPFMEKWFYRSIDKRNVIDFIQNYEKINEEFLYRYFKPSDITHFQDKILKLIGVSI